MTGIPSVSPAGARRLARLDDARVQVVVGTRPGDLGDLLAAVTSASADICRLRDDRAGEDALRTAADTFRRVCDRAAALFLVDRLPGLALQVGADGVVVGPPDVDADHARRAVGPDLIVGRIVTGAAEIDASTDQDIDLVVLEGADADLVRYAREHAGHPWFVTVPPGSPPEGFVEQGARRLAAPVEDLETATDTCWTLRRAVAAHPEL